MPIAPHPRRLTRRLLAPVAAVLTLAGVAGCDTASPADDGVREVTVIGEGQVQGSPDLLTVDVGIEFSAPDVTAAMNQTNERQGALIDALLDAGVDESDINTTSVSLQPQYTSEPGEARTITGYRATNAIRVKIRELDSASEALALIVSTGGDATRLNSVNYSIENDSQLVRDARARAFTDARDRAEQYAQLSGLTLGTVISVSERPGGPQTERPSPRPAQRALSDVPVEPGEQTVSFSVEAVWELK
ncbi:SIMPL domain-containing protein [Mycolicibacillus parakoreensis]|uniref:SIMPL domain-containing protein n=1 Tax=Mycolicibacillus parakoreensis TaxID=1069221 RepID=A0ABY3U588_9MYCO|nr:SIMPL domain-containing protein [Mycolicibacillus parakoreensis]MCV7314544.1 SIMPL domain-containing protein [Mycolicibacillus parakoreensis]ULN53125.1 SIMPL domain-containing protein [Mycolicibacillus parakoreensis]HLS00118.1 SIMPL domain-containing protein [Mycolicibacillus parakoreensis]